MYKYIDTNDSANSEEQLQKDRAGMEDSDSPTVILIILSSNKTHLSHSGKMKAWPLYMTIGNISSKAR
jgi:hypothetical protein